MTFEITMVLLVASAATFVLALCRASAERERAHEEFMPTQRQREQWLKERK